MKNDIDWLNKTVWCKLGKSKHGIGVFAIRDIPMGQCLTEYSLHLENQLNGRMTVRADEFHLIEPEIRELILDRNLFREDQEIFYFYSPNFEQNLHSFINHSKKFNTQHGVYAIKDIKKGEEITQNYNNMFEGKEPHEFIKEHMKFLW